MARKFVEREISLGRNRGKPRIWLQSSTWLKPAGFAIGTLFTATIQPNKVVIVADPKGDRKVTGKGETAIIDINTAKLRFARTKKLTVRIEKGRIQVTPRAK